MRTTARLLVGLGVVCATQLAPVVAVSAAPGGGSTVVKPSAEAWYRTTPACALPTGCTGAPAPSPYAADTLHVGVVAGAEEARTYLQLDLRALPTGTQPTGGTLLLPVSSAPADGSRTPEAATLQACAVTSAVEETDGSLAAPPATDCDAASVPAKYVPAQGEDPAAFVVDLAGLVSGWTSTSSGALALLPAADTAPPATWHVAFSDRTRTGSDVPPISATVSYTSSSVASPAAPPSVPTPAFVAPERIAPAPIDDAPVIDSGSFAAPPLTADEPAIAPQAQPVLAGQQQVVPAALSVPAEFKYPAVFVLPLLIAVAAGWLGRALTQDLVPGD